MNVNTLFVVCEKIIEKLFILKYGAVNFKHHIFCLAISY